MAGSSADWEVSIAHIIIVIQHQQSGSSAVWQVNIAHIIIELFNIY